MIRISFNKTGKYAATAAACLSVLVLAGCASLSTSKNSSSASQKASSKTAAEENKAYLEKNAVIKVTDTPIGAASLNAPASMTSSSKAVYTVKTKAELKERLDEGNCVIYIDNMIDLSDGMLPKSGGSSNAKLDAFVNKATNGAYKNYNAWKSAYVNACTVDTDDSKKGKGSELNEPLWKLSDAYREATELKVKSNTTIIGTGENSGIKGGTINVQDASNVVIRNLTLQDAYDPFPHHEAGNGYNAHKDAVSVQKNCKNIWIDHCTFEDTLELEHVRTGGTVEEPWQTYNNLCGISGTGEYIAVTYCHFSNHEKAMLIGASDSEGDASVRRITLAYNWFENCGQRMPLTRNTSLHRYNNYYSYNAGARYPSSYALGMRKGALVVSENNYVGSGVTYAVAGNAKTAETAKLYSNRDKDDSKYGNKEGDFTSVTIEPFKVPYVYTVKNVDDVPAYVKANAGAGIWIPAK